LFERALIEEIAAELGRREPRRAEPGAFEAEAAVVLMLRPTGSGLEFLAIKRVEHERDPWSGHMALPGGRREPEDGDLWATAVRETWEEVRIELGRRGRLLGQLDDVYPRTRRIPAIAITPFVVAVDSKVVASCSSEVERAVWVPLRVVVEEEHRGTLVLDALPEREFPTIEYGGHVIWGLTLNILHQFDETLKSVGYEGGGAT
jgi:8-oxo-dGTP pyrophosphatase MutT (NUDIX family)